MLGVSGDVPELEGDLGPHKGASSKVAAVANFFGVAGLVAIIGQPRPVRFDAALRKDGVPGYFVTIKGCGARRLRHGCRRPGEGAFREVYGCGRIGESVELPPALDGLVNRDEGRCVSISSSSLWLNDGGDRTHPQTGSSV
jgi:hypothetical protein